MTPPTARRRDRRRTLPRTDDPPLALAAIRGRGRSVVLMRAFRSVDYGRATPSLGAARPMAHPHLLGDHRRDHVRRRAPLMAAPDDHRCAAWRRVRLPDSARSSVARSSVARSSVARSSVARSCLALAARELVGLVPFPTELLVLRDERLEAASGQERPRCAVLAVRRRQAHAVGLGDLEICRDVVKREGDRIDAGVAEIARRALGDVVRAERVSPRLVLTLLADRQHVLGDRSRLNPCA